MPPPAHDGTYPFRMSSLKHPVGSEPNSVYWRRRITVIGALLLVIVVIAIIATNASAGTNAAPGSSVTTPDPAPSSSTPASAPSPAPPASAPPTSAATDAPAVSASGDTCSAGSITVKAVADQNSYTSLQQPKISMSITNTGASACSIDLGSSQQALTITSGAETYWSSKDCQVNGTHQNVKITAGQTLTTPSITWDRTRSSTSTCDGSRNAVPAAGASYHLTVSVGSITSSAPALMVLN